MSSLLRSLGRSFGSLSITTSTSLSAASSSSSLLARSSAFASSSALPLSSSYPSSSTPNTQQQIRLKSSFAPRRTKYRKAHKGRIPFPTGGSIKGTTLQHGIFGIRLLQPARLSAKQLQSASTALKRQLKIVKGAQVYMRTFPDVPVCVKGNETRMGKGKGSFEFWAVRAGVGKVVFEVGSSEGGGELREEVAKEALRLASAKLPVPTEFISLATAPRLGNLVLDEATQEAHQQEIDIAATGATSMPPPTPAEMGADAPSVTGVKGAV